MIQFNLLPDVKLEYIRAAKFKRLVISISALVSAVVVVVVGILSVSVLGLQRQHIRNLDSDIQKYRGELENTEDLSKVLTIQNQLSQLPGLHDQKPAVSRLYGYITQLTPAEISYSKLDLSFTDQRIEINGKADTISSVNKFVDTLKFTKFVEIVDGESGAESMAFSEVVLQSFARVEDVSYKVTLKFNPVIFDNTKTIELVVPQMTSTRSELGKPLFEQDQSEETIQ